MNCHLLECFCSQLVDKNTGTETREIMMKEMVVHPDCNQFHVAILIVSAEWVWGLKDNYSGCTVIFTVHSVLHIPEELTLIIFPSLFLPVLPLCSSHPVNIYLRLFPHHPLLVLANISSIILFLYLPNHGSNLSLLFSPPRLHLSSLQVSVWTYCWRCVVVLHPYHHFFLHSQPGCFPHCGEDGVTHWECRGLGQTDRDRLRDSGLRLYQGVLQGMDSSHCLLAEFRQRYQAFTV